MNVRVRTAAALAMLGVLSLAAAACGDDSGSSSSSATTVATTTASTSGGSTGSGGTAATTASSTPGSGSTAAKSPMVIGSLGAFTGSFGAQYSRGPAAIKAWAKTVNDSGGINGHPIEVHQVDDQNDPAKSLSALKNLVENEHAVAIVGAFGPGTDASWSDYITSKKVPVIGGLAATSPVWFTNPYFFPAQNTFLGYLDFTFYVAKKAGGKNAGVLSCSEFSACTEGNNYFAESAKKAGIAWGGTVGLPVAAPDYTAQCKQMQSKNIDVLYASLSQTITLKAVQDCDRQKYNPIVVLPDSPVPEVLGDKVLQGDYIVLPSPLGWNESDLTKQFRAAMAKYSPDTSLNEWGSTTGWQAALLFGEAAKNVPDNPTPADIVKGLLALPPKYTNSGWSPPLTFTAGKPAQVDVFGWIAQIKDGKLTAPLGPASIPFGQ